MDVGSGAHEVRDPEILLWLWRRDIVAEPEPPALRSLRALQHWAAARGGR